LITKHGFLGFCAVPNTHTTPILERLSASACPTTLEGERERERERKKERKCVLIVYDPSWQKETTIVFKAILSSAFESVY